MKTGGWAQGGKIDEGPRRSDGVARERSGGLIRGGRLTKAAGMVASVAPLAGRAKLLLSAAAIGMLAEAAAAQEGSPPPPSQDCIEVSGSDSVMEFTCSGSYIRTPRQFRAVPGKRLKVTLGTQTSAGSRTRADMFYLTSYDGIDFQQQGRGTGFIDSAGAAIHAAKLARREGGEGGAGVSSSGGSVNIRFVGKITAGRSGGSYGGIYAVNRDRAGGGVTVAVGEVGSPGNAVRVVNQGVGAISVTATGTVTSRLNDGIVASNAQSGSLTVVAATVSGSTGGVVATQLGGGAISIRASGSVAASSGHGISAVSSGTGAVSIHAAAAVSGSGAGGVGILARANGGSLFVSAAAVTGSAAGVRAVQAGSGAVSVAATGSVNVASGDGIHALGSGTGAVSVQASGTIFASAARAHGIYASGSGGDVTVTAASVNGGGVGILARSASRGGVEISATGAVDGGSSHGIRAMAATGPVLISASETVKGSGTRGAGIWVQASGGAVAVDAADVEGVGAGILAIQRGNGNVSLTATGSVSASAGIGIHAIGSGTGAVNVAASSVSGSGAGGHGIYAKSSGGAVSVLAAGVTGGADGIRARGLGAELVSVTATGVVLGATGHGVHATGRKVSISLANGAFAGGSQSHGIYVDAVETASLTVSGSVLGRLGGAAIRTKTGSSATVMVTLNSGAIVGGTVGNSTIAFQDDDGDATVAVMSGAMISGSVTGGGGRDSLSFESGASGTVLGVSGVESVTVKSGASVALRGTPTGLNDLAVAGTLRLDDGAASRIAIGGSFTGGGTVSIDVNFGSSTADLLAISGSVSGTTTIGVKAIGVGREVKIVDRPDSASSSGLFSVGPGYLLRFDGGDVYVSPPAASNTCSNGAQGGSAFVCRGSISSAQTLSSSGSGTLTIDIDAKASFEVASQTALSASQSGAGGIEITQASSGTAITGGADGIRAANTGGGFVSVTTTGTVTGRGRGDSVAGIAATSDSSGSGVTVSAASVQGAANGIRIVSAGTGAVVVSASGSVAGSNGHGIYVKSSGGAVSISATASVSGRGHLKNGISAETYGSGTVTVSVGGTVSGDSRSNAAAISASGSSGTIDVILNSGADVGSDGSFAVTTQAEEVTVTVNSGARLTGVVWGGEGKDTLTFGNGSVGSINRTHQIDHIRIEAGARVTVRDQFPGRFIVAYVETLKIGGALNLDDGKPSQIQVASSFVGGGTVTVDADFSDGQADRFVLNNAANVTGTTTIRVNAIGSGTQGLTILSGASGSLAGKFAIDSDSPFDLKFDQPGSVRLVAKSGDSSPVEVTKGTCAEQTGERICRGEIETSQVLNASGTAALNVVVRGSTTFDVASGSALDLTHTGSGGIMLEQDSDGGTISGAASGIAAANTGGGSVSIAVTGTVTGSGGQSDDAGIRATNDASGAGLAVTAAAVEGARHGILAIGSGTGATRITAKGAVVGTVGDGIYAKAGASDLSITAGSVNGGGAGIRASTTGAGDIVVRATGAVSGADYGIRAEGGDALTVNTRAVTGGIYAKSLGRGAISIGAAGLVENRGDSKNGIRALGSGAISIAAATVSGSAAGIFAEGLGNGAIHIRTTGSVSGDADQGIHAAGSGLGAVTVNATGGKVSSSRSQGIRVSGSGTLTVSAAAVEGHSTGIHARGLGSGAVSVDAAGAVVGSEEHGIDAAGRGVSVSAVSVTGYKFGIRAKGAGGGDVSVVVTGAVETGKDNGDGIRATNDAQGSALTVMAAAVKGERHGIWAKSEGNGRFQISASGAVAGGTGSGIYARSDRANLSITAAAATGGSIGIHAVSDGNGAIRITARGAATGRGGHGIHAVGSGTGAVSVSASSARGTGREKHGIYAEASAAVTVAAGAVTGDAVGIRVKASGSGAIGVSATGAVTGRSQGIHVSGGGNMTIAAAAVTGGSDGVVAANSGVGTINFRASGDIIGTSGHGIQLTTSGAITLNAAGGSVSGGGSGKHGILASGAGGVRVSAATVTGSAIGIDARSASGAVRIDATGAVSGATGAGIHAHAGTGGLSITAATVSGGSAGISAVSADNGAIGISTAGSVRGERGHGIEAVGSGSGAVSVSASGAVAGFGSGKDGITVSGSGTLTVSAAAAVVGSAAGIRAVGSGSGSVSVVSRAVTGGTSGIHVANTGGGSVSISATGTVTGSGAGDNASGIRATNGEGGTVLTVIADSVRGARHGIWIDNSGSGATEVEAHGFVSGAVGHGIRVKGKEAINIDLSGGISGGTASGMAAIHSDSSSGKNVSIALHSGADVGRAEGGLAILDGAGNAKVKILAGANVSGNVNLGSGADELSVEGGVMKGGSLFGGAGVDALKVELSGNIDAVEVAGWESIVIEAGANFAVSDLDAQNVLVRGTLSLSDGKTSSATIAGNFIGGGTLVVDADMGERKADVLTVQGDVAGRPTAVVVRGVGGLTPGDQGVLFARVEGEATVSGANQAFVAADAGAGGGPFAYRYTVEGDESGGDTEFFLKVTGGSLNEVGAAMTKAASALASGFARTPSAAARSAARTSAPGSRREVGQATAFGRNPAADSKAIWTRIHSSRIDHGTGPNGDSAETAASGFQLGADLLSVEAESGEWVFGVTGQYGSSTLEAKTPFGTGTVESAGFGLGVGATWQGKSGLYVDAQAQFNQTESDYTSSTEGRIKNGSESAATVASIEIGRRLGGLDFLGDAALTSTGKLSWASISGDSFTTSGANPLEVDFGSDSILTVGVGMAAEFETDAGRFRISSAVARDLGDAPDVVIDGVTYGGGDALTRLEFGVGGLVSVGESAVLLLDGEFWTGSGGDTEESGSTISGSLRWSW